VNLNYTILWYDDDRDFFESLDKEPIEEKIASWGFRPRIVPVHDTNELQQHAPFDQFDMLVVDFKLGGDEHGDQFIRGVRDQSIYAEIIFYSTSASSELWQAIHEKQLEGVFVTNKAGIHQKLLRVAEQSVRKVLDLENMRGIVMSEVGDLDELLESIFTLAMQGITEEQQKLVFNGFVEKSREPDSRFEEALKAFEEAPSIEKLLQLCDSSDKRVQNFNRVRRHHPLLKEKDFSDEYQKEILKPRNFLAHGVPLKKEDGSFLFRHRGKEYSFNDDISHALRKRILEYRNAFTELRDTLAQQPVT
jgi:hypothetical protein